MKSTLFILLLSCCTLFAKAQGIEFFTEGYDKALEKAKQENKLVFVDFYATWCGPCKQLAQEVFPLKEIGDYFNAHFISIQIDAEQVENQALVKRCKVNAYPTLAILDANGKIVSITTGALDENALLKFAKVATGDEMSFEETYEAYRKQQDLDLLQEVLMGAPAFIGTLESDMERQKWIVRIDKLFKEYAKKKMDMGDAFINKEDYNIVATYHEETGKPDDPIVEFINKNIDAYLKLGKAPAYFIVSNNNKVIETLAHAGKEEYKQYLDRINGDMKKAYDAIEWKGELSTYERFKCLYDAEYVLFYERDGDRYVELMEEYFSAMDTTASPLEYGAAAQKVFPALGNNIPEHIQYKMIDWTVTALKSNKLPILQKINMLVLAGDIYKNLRKVAEAKEYYNQAFMESLQLDQKMTAAMIQMQIKRRLGELELINN